MTLSFQQWLNAPQNANILNQYHVLQFIDANNPDYWLATCYMGYVENSLAQGGVDSPSPNLTREQQGALAQIMGNAQPVPFNVDLSKVTAQNILTGVIDSPATEQPTTETVASSQAQTQQSSDSATANSTTTAQPRKFSPYLVLIAALAVVAVLIIVTERK